MKVLFIIIEGERGYEEGYGVIGMSMVPYSMYEQEHRKERVIGTIEMMNDELAYYVPTVPRYYFCHFLLLSVLTPSLSWHYCGE